MVDVRNIADGAGYWVMNPGRPARPFPARAVYLELVKSWWFVDPDGNVLATATTGATINPTIYTTEAEAIEGWRAAVVAHVKARRLDDQHLIQEAFDGHPGALEWAESVTDTITRLERKRDSLTALLAQAEADNRAWAERCRWIPVGEKMPEAGQRVHVWDGRDQGVGVPLAGFRGGWATTHGVPPTHWRPLDPGPDAT